MTNRTPFRWQSFRMVRVGLSAEDAFVLGKGSGRKEPTFGYNAQTGEYEDVVKAGVLDPTKVVRTALTNAGSISSLMLTTEVLVSEIPEEKKGAPMPGGHGGGIGDMYQRRRLATGLQCLEISRLEIA